MMLSSPANIPVKLLHTLYGVNRWAYIGVVFLVYLFVPYWVTAYLSKFTKRLKGLKKLK